MDRYDVLTALLVVGLVLMATGVYVALGLAPTLVFVGMALIVVAFAGAVAARAGGDG